MGDETLKLGLDPKQVVAAMREIASESETLAKQIEDALGKDAAKSVKKLEESAEKGSSRIAQYFSNLGKRVKEDLKAAFDFSKVMAGIKFTDEIAKGAKQVLDMERAFDRLNVRLGATHKQFASFKTELGKSVSSAGASLDKVLPGVEAVASRGGVKDTGQLASIGGILAKAQAATGEDTQSLGENISEAILARKEKVTPETFKAMADATMAARNSGAFHSLGESSAAIFDIAGLTKRMGMGTRETAALAAQSSTAGAPGMSAMKNLLEMASGPGGKGKVNALLGQDIFKNGKLDVGALGKVNLNRGGLQEQQAAQAFGFSGGNAGEDFIQFINAFKRGNESFKQVINGSDENAKAFDAATQNFASRLDRFKEKLTNAGREIVGGASEAAEGVFSGNTGKISGGIKQSASGIADNAGTLAAGLGATAAIGVLFGGGLKGLAKGALGSAGDVGKGLALQKATGVTPVFVTNFSDMSGTPGGAFDKVSKLAGVGKLLGGAGLVGAAGAAGYGAGTLINKIPGVSEAVVGALEKVSQKTGMSMTDEEAMKKGEAQFKAQKEQMEAMKQAVREGSREGTSQAKLKVEQKGNLTNPSSVAPRGRGM